MQRRRLIIAVAAIAIVALVVVAVAAFRARGGHEIFASGTIEVTQSELAPKVSGRLVALRVRDGDPVRRGEVVAVLEHRVPGLTVDQARATLAAARAQVAAARAALSLQSTEYSSGLNQAREGVAIAGAGVGEAGTTLDIEARARQLALDQARAQERAAHAALEHAAIDLSRATSLVRSGDEPQQRLDDARDAYASALAQARVARDSEQIALAQQRNVHIRELGVQSSSAVRGQSIAALDAAHAQSDLVSQRRAQVRAADAALAQAQAELGLAEDQVAETRLVAPYDGFVLSHNFEVGDLIGAGAAVMTIGNLHDPYVYVYVGETEIPQVKAGARADVQIDGLPGRTFAGVVTEIGDTAEFTPENVQTAQARIEYLVFRVKIQLHDTSGTLKPGLPVDAMIHV